MRIAQIYSLVDPITNEIRYIGKTIMPLSKRLSTHYRDKHLTHKTCWITSLKKVGLKPLIKSIEICDEETLTEREIYWISYFKEKCNLTNSTNGGDGLPIGFKHSGETKRKISECSKIPNSGNFKKGQKRVNSEIAIEKTKKKIIVYDIDGNFLEVIKGIKEASKKLKINRSNITACLKNKLTHIRNFRFYYYNENYRMKINSIKNEIIIINKPIEEYENGILVKEYNNAKEASSVLKIKYYTMNNILIGKTKKCRDYPDKIWKYKE